MRRRVAIFTPSNRLQPARYRSAGNELFYQRRGVIEILRLNTLDELLRNGFRLASSRAERMRGGEVTSDLCPAGYLLASALRRHGAETFAAREVTGEALARLEAFGPDLICISTTFMDSADELARVSEALWEAAPGVRQVAGGMMVWKHLLLQRRLAAEPGLVRHAEPPLFDDRALLRRCHVDAFVLHPFSLTPLLEILAVCGQRRPDWSAIDNLFARGPRGRYRFTRAREARYDGAQDAIDWQALDELPRSIPLRTSVGCPHRCLFCDYAECFAGVHAKPQQELTRELRALRDRAGGAAGHHIYCVDDNTFYSPARVRQVCDAFRDAGVELPWYTMSEIEKITPRSVERVARTNLVGISVGLESGDDAVLANMNKRLDRARFRRSARLLDRRGVSLYLTLIAGYPGETLESIERTAAFVDGLGLGQALSAYQIYPLAVMPLAALSRAESRARFLLEGAYQRWRHATCSSRTVHQRIAIYLHKIRSLYLNHADSPPLVLRALAPEARRVLLQLRRDLALGLIDDVSGAALQHMVRGACARLGYQADVPRDLRRHLVVRQLAPAARPAAAEPLTDRS